MFITFEGGDGSGKSTQIERLKQYLTAEGYRVLLTREPGGTSISEQIREILLNKDNTMMTDITETMLYAAARAQLVSEVIRPALAEGCFVICDRFLDSSVAYQGYGRGLGDAVEEINRYGIEECMPDLTIYLRVDPKIGRDRIEGRQKDRIESEAGSFHDKVFQGYEALSREYPDRIFTVNADGTIEDIEMKIREKVIERIHAISSGQ